MTNVTLYTPKLYIQSVYFRVFRIQNGRQKLFYVHTYEQFNFFFNQSRPLNKHCGCYSLVLQCRVIIGCDKMILECTFYYVWEGLWQIAASVMICLHVIMIFCYVIMTVHTLLYFLYCMLSINSNNKDTHIGCGSLDKFTFPGWQHTGQHKALFDVTIVMQACEKWKPTDYIYIYIVKLLI